MPATPGEPTPDGALVMTEDAGSGGRIEAVGQQ
jgi:hypothetical protein